MARTPNRSLLWQPSRLPQVGVARASDLQHRQRRNDGHIVSSIEPGDPDLAVYRNSTERVAGMRPVFPWRGRGTMKSPLARAFHFSGKPLFPAAAEPADAREGDAKER